MNYLINDDGTVTVGEVKQATDVIADLENQIREWQENADMHENLLGIANAKLKELIGQRELLQNAPQVQAALAITEEVAL